MSTLCAGKFCNQAIIKGTYESRDTEYEIETQSKLHYENSVFGLPGDGNEIQLYLKCADTIICKVPAFVIYAVKYCVDKKDLNNDFLYTQKT